MFPILSPALQARLKAAGVGYLDWSARALPVGEALAEGEVVGTNFERKYRREGRPFHAVTLRRVEPSR